MATCKDCIHWDANNQITYAEEPGVTASRCMLVEENNHAALMTIRHHLDHVKMDPCNVYLITKSNFTCSALLQRDGIPVQTEVDVDEEKESRSPSLARKIAKTGADATLWAIDLTLDYMLRRRQNERTIKPTKRITFSPKLRRELLQEQNRKCMYCGAPKSIKTTDVDHKTPVIRGGPNEKSNYQILCKPCNQRKGAQTDEEFRKRYAELLPRFRRGQRPVPPEQPVSQKEFRRVTKETQMGESIREFKKTKYISPRQKISSGTPVAGGIVGVVFFLGTALILPEAAWAGNLSVVAGLITGVCTWAGLMVRAKHTGRFDM